MVDWAKYQMLFRDAIFWFVIAFGVYIYYRYSIQQPPSAERKFKSVGEQLCVEILEEFLGRTIKVNIRPDFLKNPKSGKNLELDGYDPIKNIAIEYNGEQHYKYPNVFHKSKTEFKDQQSRDLLKERLCKENNIKLIVVSYELDSKYKNVKDRRKVLKDYIYAELEKIF